MTAASRQCGRCRQHFEGDAALNERALPDWWLCPACRVILVGDTAADAG